MRLRHVILLAGAAAAVGPFVEPLFPVLRRATVPVLPPGSAPLRVLHVSDLHLLPRHTMTVVAGPPVDLSRWQGKELTSEVLREATGAVMHAITDLLEQIRGGHAPAKAFEFHGERKSA